MTDIGVKIRKIKTNKVSCPVGGANNRTGWGLVITEETECVMDI